MKGIKYSVALLCIIQILACGTTRKAAVPIELNALRVSANNNPMQVFRGAAPRVWDLIHTTATILPDFEAKTAHVSESIFIKPHAKDTDLIVLDAKGMMIESVELTAYYQFRGGKGDAFRARRMPLKYVYNGRELFVSLPKYWRDSSSSAIHRPHMADLELHFEYTAQPYADSTVGGSAAITEDRGLYFINTDGANKNKPGQIWTQGETESNSHWLITIDKPNQRTTTKLTLAVPDSMQTLSNGFLDRSSALGESGWREDVWVMNDPIQPYAIMFAIGRFVVTKDAHPGGVPVAYYVEPQYADAAKDIFKNTPAMIDYFSAATGVAYPWNKYSQVVVRDYVSGAMENTSASLFGEFMNGTRREIVDKPGNEDVVSHELFHQWFGDYVTAESWSNLTLNESFATYGEVLWRRHSQGQSSADEHAVEGLARYIQSTESKDPPLVRYYYRDKEEMFDRVSYQKGGAILRYMHGLMGDAAFSRAMQRYLTKNALQPAEVSDWRKAVEEATGQDWTQFFNEWYFRGGYPVLNIRYDYDDAAHRLIVTTRQRGKSDLDTNILFHLPLKAGILEGGKLRVMDWKLNRKANSDTISYTGTARPVFIPDYYRWMPGIINDLNKTADMYAAQFMNTRDYMPKRSALSKAIAQDKKAYSAALLSLTKAALNDTIPGIRYLAVNSIGAAPEAWKDELRQQVIFLATQDRQNRIRAAAFTVLGMWKNTPGGADLAKAAVNDESYLVGGAALRALAKMQPDTAYNASKALLAAAPRGDAEDAALDVIAKKGRPEDFAIFTERTTRNTGAKQTALAGKLFTYALATTNDATFTRALQALQDMLPAENIKGYRSGIGALIFYTGARYRQAKSKEDKAIAARRTPITEGFEQKVIADEKDETVKEQYRILKSRELIP